MPTSGTLATLAGTEIFSNKTIIARSGTEATNTATSINTDNYDYWSITALGSANTITVTGTPNNAQKLIIRIKDNGTARALTFNSIFRFSSDAPAPSNTTISKTMYIGFSWNSTDSKWDCISPYIDNF